MAYEQREGSGVMFKNFKKTEGSGQPDYRGDALFNGETIEVAAWVKEGAKGKFFSLSIKAKQAYTPKQEEKKSDPFDDDCPF